MNGPASLIIGADGTLGSALFKRLQEKGWTVHGTVFDRPPRKNEFTFNIMKDVDGFVPPEGITEAFILAAQTSMDYCSQHPKESAAINVDATSALAEKLAGQKVFVVFPSTNMVFDGSEPRVKQEKPVNPANEYGRQKSEAETRILALEKSAVVRFTKVLHPGFPLFAKWIEELREGREITPFEDMYFSPVPLSLCLQALSRAAEWKVLGLFQVSGKIDISYAEAALHIARRIGADEKLVRPVKAVDVLKSTEPPPRNTTMDTKRLRADLNLEAPDVWTTIDDAVGLNS